MIGRDKEVKVINKKLVPDTSSVFVNNVAAWAHLLSIKRLGKLN